MKKQVKYCIFCFRPDSKIRFTREHIIPRNIGGNLFIDEVCEKCNSTLGKGIDIQVLKYREILRALESLGVPHDKAGILKSYFKITAKSDELELPAVFEDGQFKMVPTELPDGSIVIPEEINDKVLSKMVKRDERIRSSKVSGEYIEKEIKRLKEKYNSAKPGEIIHGRSIGRSLKKRKDRFTITVEPKGKSEIERLIAKIYYEFLYFVEGRFIFHHADEFGSIVDLIDKGNSSNDLHFSNQEPKFQNPIPTHLIRLIWKDTYQRLYVSFFGILDFQLLTFFHYSIFWDEIRKRFETDDIAGIHFEQNVKSGRKSFWFVDNNGAFIELNA